jgi:cytoskeletal protein CcmA (bactofilin family)
MAIFAEKGQGTTEAGAGLSIIGAGMKVVGDLSAEGVVKIEGMVVGTVRAGRQVLVAKGGVVEGDLFTREAIVGGDVRGGIQAEERVEIQASSVVHGDIATRRLFVQEGGEINGVIRMGEDVTLGRDAERRRQTTAPKLSGTY